MALLTSLWAASATLRASTPRRQLDPSSPSTAPASAPRKLRGAPTPTPPMWLQGPLLKAAALAVNELLAATIKETTSPRASELQRCLARMENYDVRIFETPDHYALYVRPSLERCVKDDDEALKGGDAEYEVSKDDFRILNKSYGE